MSEVKQAAQDLLDALKTERDDLKVQLHLASSDLKDRIESEWSGLEGKFEQLKADVQRLNRHAQNAAQSIGNEIKGVGDDVEQTAEKLASEIRGGYLKLRDRLKG